MGAIGSSAACVRPISSDRVGVGVSGSSGSMVTVHARVRGPVGGDAGRPVHGAHAQLRIRRPPGRVERGVLDVVAHRDDRLLAHRLDVHQRPAVVQVERAVVVVLHGHAEVHELGRCADVELHALEGDLDRVPFEAEEPLHAPRVDRARTHPLVDGHVGHHAETLVHHERHPRPVDEMARQ